MADLQRSSKSATFRDRVRLHWMTALDLGKPYEPVMPGALSLVGLYVPVRHFLSPIFCRRSLILSRSTGLQ